MREQALESTQHRVHLSRAARPAYDALETFSKTVAALAVDAGIDERLKELSLIHASQLNGCAYCVRLHTDRGVKAGLTADDVGQIAVWRESSIFTERERAALELTEAHVFIHEEGVSDEVYDRVGGILSEEEYVALSWLLVSINAFNRVAIAGRYPVLPRRSAPKAAADDA
ncbi:carboxymuconolactone decarboxylase family protein [Microbacterium sp. EYE_5]|uniref:carboxymuconolactone decarboxylase family protein n=1 Tax=unclassified Microbacterium TaxID=2609290 RepID=UPI00200500BA|nr:MULTISPECIES: carboxymuconolactone decarboxylase family protein [unclassified Microbacterium]MCK6081438.1 carboxymuconolactone decarboxylase family protein [Microbacterium sp. EYE_382]MCK6086708.1 carboxymuconolactone decarboxylase family protein [Microbacterium sp. EYE_384]MCK6123794.1 carboxymuconolactone decarboxylase family protein [Microbacterium sp. EYE_80]MCK6126703.1 carboxymuconolactone decarboxylase family protein [Microbacterium sp. EYE_79]MCK6142393.1 carboxymuconolactone decarb